MTDRISSMFSRIVRELQGGFVLRPGAITVALAVLAIGLSALEKRVSAVKVWSDLLDRLFPPEPAAAYIVLGTIAGSMISVVSVVYSILLVVLTFASAQFSPRVLVAFVEDRVSQTTLGVFIGTFSYCLLTLPAIRSQPTPFVPSVAVIGAMILAIACLACLLYFIHHIAVSIQASTIVDRIARETERIIDQVLPRPLVSTRDGATDEAAARLSGGNTPVLASVSGYIQSIDEPRLLATAQAYNTILRVERYIGQFVAAGTPVVGIFSTGEPPAGLQAATLQAFAIGPARTMDQDAEFGVLQIVDIALKAMSPAINDPTTALTCIDQLGRLMVRAAGREPAPTTLRDAYGRVKVVLQRTAYPRLLDVAFSQIRHYGRTDVAVPLRLMRVLGELAVASRHPPYAAATREQAVRLAAACAQTFPEEEQALLAIRLEAVERAVAACTRAESEASTDAKISEKS